MGAKDGVMKKMILISLLVVSAGQLFGASGDKQDDTFSFLLQNRLRVPIQISRMPFAFPNIRDALLEKSAIIEIKPKGFLRLTQDNKGSEHGIAPSIAYHVKSSRGLGPLLYALFSSGKSPGKYKGDKAFILSKDDNNKAMVEEVTGASKKSRLQYLRDNWEVPFMKGFLVKLDQIHNKLSEFNIRSLKHSGHTQAGIHKEYGVPLNDIKGTIENNDLTEFTRNLARKAYDLYKLLPEDDSTKK